LLRILNLNKWKANIFSHEGGSLTLFGGVRGLQMETTRLMLCLILIYNIQECTSVRLTLGLLRGHFPFLFLLNRRGGASFIPHSEYDEFINYVQVTESVESPGLTTFDNVLSEVKTLGCSRMVWFILLLKRDRNDGGGLCKGFGEISYNQGCRLL
jgi:hypothetical protein